MIPVCDRFRSKARRPRRRAFLLCLIVILVLPLLFPTLPASASEAPPGGEVRNVLLVNLENNLILHEKSADTLIYPSSSVKIMTGLLASDRLVDRRTDGRRFHPVG